MKSFIVMIYNSWDSYEDGRPVGMIQALSLEEAMTRLGLDQDLSGLPQEARDFMSAHGMAPDDEIKKDRPDYPGLWWHWNLQLKEVPELSDTRQLLSYIQENLDAACHTGKYALPAS